MCAAVSNNFTIAGAGIAGLTTALCLKQRNIKCTLIEKREALADEGAGIQITPNAFHVLEWLGLGDALKQRAHQVQAITLRQGKSHSKITAMPLGSAFEQAHNAPYLVIHRADLMALLHEACQKVDIPIQFNRDVTDLDTDTPLIGADGVWSKTRERVSAAPATFSNRIAFRAIIDAEPGEAFSKTHDVTITFGTKGHVVYYPLKGGKQLNMVCIVQGAKGERRWSQPANAEQVLSHLQNWSPAVKALVKRTDNWQRWPLFTVSPKAPWTTDTTALIGDAAHAMVPFVAQGGAMAIEDAAVLAHAIATHKDVPTAFSSYESARKARVTKVWHEAMSNGERYHMGGLKAMIRNTGLQAIGGERLARRYNWIYEWRPPR